MPQRARVVTLLNGEICTVMAPLAVDEDAIRERQFPSTIQHTLQILKK